MFDTEFSHPHPHHHPHAHHPHHGGWGRRRHPGRGDWRMADRPALFSTLAGLADAVRATRFTDEETRVRVEAVLADARRSIFAILAGSPAPAEAGEGGEDHPEA